MIGVETVRRAQQGRASERLVVNEIAPRVHNSGHWTIDGAQTSQFEQHIRAIAGWPLGSPTRRGAIEMHNLIGEDADEWRDILAQPDLSLHLYGKLETRPGRKMGHVTRVFPRGGQGPLTFNRLRLINVFSPAQGESFIAEPTLGRGKRRGDASCSPRVLVPVDVHEPEVARKAVAVGGGDGQGIRVRASPGLCRQPDPARLAAAPVIPQNVYDEIGVYEKSQLDAMAARHRQAARGRTRTPCASAASIPNCSPKPRNGPADLIIVGAHRRSMATFLLGSTASALSRHAKCTVMIVRSPLKAKLI